MKRRFSARWFEAFRSTNRIWMEELEQRVLLSTSVATAVNAVVASPALQAATASPTLANPPVPAPPLPTGQEPEQGVVGTPFSLDPQLFDGAYSFDGIYFTPPTSPGELVVGNGGGLPGATPTSPETDIQTIAIVDAYGSPTIVNDLQTFDQHWGITDDDAAGNFALTVQPLGATVNTISEGAVDIAGWAEETSLDVEWAHAVAPGAHILLVEAPSDSLLDLFAADLYAASQTGVVVVSNSFGSVGGVPDLPYLYDGYLVTPTGHLDPSGTYGGVAFFASSGDDGPGLSIPAASQDVIGVGGQTISVDADGQVQTYANWDDSGGGDDTDYGSPGYNEPLVALDANPSSGVWVYNTNGIPATLTSPGLSPGWNVIGGTSLACPVMGAYMTIIDQGLELAGLPSDGTDFDSDQVLGYDLQDMITFDNEISLSEAESTFTALNRPPPASYPLFPKNPLNYNDYPTLVPGNADTGWGSPVGPNFAASVIDYQESDTIFFNDLNNMITPPQWVSSGFDAAGLPMDYLTFAELPSNPIAGQTLTNLVVDVDPFSSTTPDPTYNGPVSLSVEYGPSGGALEGTVTVNAVAGVATFSDVTINTAGNYYLEASSTGTDTNGDGIVPGKSLGLAVYPAPEVAIAFTQEPESVWQYSTTQAVVVSTVDQFGNINPNDNSTSITLSIASGPAGAVLATTTTRTVVNGSAIFGGLSLNLPGTYTLKATDGALGSAVSIPFTVVAIPVRETTTLNGFGLSTNSLLLQERRDGATIVSTPVPSVIQQVNSQTQVQTQSAPSPVLESQESPSSPAISSTSSSSDTTASPAAASNNFGNANLSNDNTDDGGADANLLDSD